MKIQCLVSNPPVLGESYAQRWEGPDQGWICCWLRGIEKAKEDPELAAKAIRGELPVLAWKGGVEKKIKTGGKIGSFNYIATWQGLRGEDLNIDPTTELELKCARTGVTAMFTSSIERLKEI